MDGGTLEPKQSHRLTRCRQWGVLAAGPQCSFVYIRRDLPRALRTEPPQVAKGQRSAGEGTGLVARAEAGDKPAFARYFLFVFYLAVPHGLQDSGSTTRD